MNPKYLALAVLAFYGSTYTATLAHFKMTKL
jgi:hypothetical protein